MKRVPPSTRTREKIAELLSEGSTTSPLSEFFTASVQSIIEGHDFN